MGLFGMIAWVVASYPCSLFCCFSQQPHVSRWYLGSAWVHDSKWGACAVALLVDFCRLECSLAVNGDVAAQELTIAPSKGTQTYTRIEDPIYVEQVSELIHGVDKECSPVFFFFQDEDVHSNLDMLFLACCVGIGSCLLLLIAEGAKCRKSRSVCHPAYQHSRT